MQAFHDGSSSSSPRIESVTDNGGLVLDPFYVSLPTDGLNFTDHHEGRFDNLMSDPLMMCGGLPLPPPTASAKAPPLFPYHNEDPGTSAGTAKSRSSTKTGASPAPTSKAGGKANTTKRQQQQKQATKTKEKVPKKAVSKKTNFKMKKAPGAPRRFKSAYMFFSTKKHKELREELNKNGQVKVRTFG